MYKRQCLHRVETGQLQFPEYAIEGDVEAGIPVLRCHDRVRGWIRGGVLHGRYFTRHFAGIAVVRDRKFDIRII